MRHRLRQGQTQKRTLKLGLVKIRACLPRFPRSFLLQRVAIFVDNFKERVTRLRHKSRVLTCAIWVFLLDDILNSDVKYQSKAGKQSEVRFIGRETVYRPYIYII